ncbi:MAG TPA: single-stranded DNA-binding protein [Propionibacteriaceae bacterium]|jgi:single-strand DNA-binding protein|nr:single-stranded DNA-binding protein [Propionibacteriaceae bacterium]
MEALVQMTGHVGTEVDIRGNGSVTAFRLACTPRVRGKDGEYSDGNTTWIDVTCFRSLAANVAASVRKGDPVIVIGRLRTSVWTKDGQTRERLGLEAEAVGHDLSRGTAIFRKSVRQSAEPADADEPPEEFDQAGLNAEERRAAQADEAARSIRAA